VTPLLFGFSHNDVMTIKLNPLHILLLFDAKLQSIMTLCNAASFVHDVCLSTLTLLENVCMHLVLSQNMRRHAGLLRHLHSFLHAAMVLQQWCC
jgi:hypothetical protein